jgi:tellurite resistance protein TerC
VDGKGQSKVLLWGILGAIVLRAIFIFAGSWLIDLTFLPTFSIGNWTFGGDENNPEAAPHFGNINMLITVFGSMLVYGGFKTLLIKESADAKDFGNSIGAKIARKLFPVRMNFYGNRFFILEKRKYFATLLFVVLCVIETTDLIFAVDSIPAIFSIAPNDPFILYSSNIFAIFGLRSLYFLIANSMDRFSKLQFGISFILIFIGVKMLIVDFYHIHTSHSLIFIICVFVIAIVASVLRRGK